MYNICTYLFTLKRCESVIKIRESWNEHWIQFFKFLCKVVSRVVTTDEDI